MEIEFEPLQVVAKLLAMKWDVSAKDILKRMSEEEMHQAAIVLGVGIKGVNGNSKDDICNKLENIRRNR